MTDTSTVTVEAIQAETTTILEQPGPQPAKDRPASDILGHLLDETLVDEHPGVAGLLGMPAAPIAAVTALSFDALAAQIRDCQTVTAEDVEAMLDEWCDASSQVTFGPLDAWLRAGRPHIVEPAPSAVLT